MSQSKKYKNETKAHSIMTIKKTTLLTGKHPKNIGIVGKITFSITTHDRTQ
jgi:CRISPR/Cas system endoribonuclease Cas6 (RAMP superfamily)